ncbi:MAG TPA: ExeM/NucH family extracellular endonuclease [Nocardioides sp.]|nr:ExeM/NucH family extracellular endonuclease [Nocardioides sp.]
MSRPAPRRILLTAVVLALPAALLQVVSLPSAQAVSPDIVISQVYGGGGNSGATLINDYVELRNTGTSTVDVTGWSVQYASASGTTWQTTALSGSIPAGGYYLVQEAAGAGGTTPLPTPDATGSIPMSATAGKVALVTEGTALSCGADCDAAAGVRDFIGYGTANDFEGPGAAPGLSNTTAALRGAFDTDTNSLDFTVGAPVPRNSGHTETPPTDCNTAATHQIAQVQGAGTTTPLAGQAVRVEGVATGDFQQTGGLGGFFVQDATPDDDPATSDGVFVATTQPAAPGDRVLVSGTAQETNGLTQISSTDVDVCGTGTITAATYDLPRPAGVTFEPVEGVLVTFPEPLTATEHFQLGRFGEVTVSSDGRLIQPTNVVQPGAPAQALFEEAARRRLLIDDGSNVQNPATVPFLEPDAVRIGDTASGITGVLSFGFNLYRLQPTAPIEFARTNPRPTGPEDVGGDVKVASFNTLNYFTTLTTENPDARGANSPEEFARQQIKEVEAITGIDSDVIGLMEVENNGSEAIASLVQALNDATAPGTYAYVTEPVINAPNEFGGTFGTDAIKVALIYRPAAVTPVGAAQSSADPVFDRPPLIQAFAPVGGGESFTVAVNHFTSKNCDPGSDPLDFDQGDGQACFNNRRILQAQALDGLIDTMAPPNPLIIGDLNSYAEEDPIHVLEDAGYTGLSEEFIDADSRYSFVFDGFSGELDHAMASADLLDKVTGATIWHINADEPLILDYNLDFGRPASLFEPNEFRASDHDPFILGLALVNDAPTVDAGGPYTVKEGGSVTLTATGTDPDGDDLQYAWDLDRNGSFETTGQSVVFPAGHLQAPATVSVPVRVTDPDGLTGTDTASVKVIFDFGGFVSPIKNPPAVNQVIAGLPVPVLFKLGGFQGLNVLAAGSPSSTRYNCSTGAPIGAAEKATSLFGAGLTFIPGSRTYLFPWTTKRAWAGTCRHFELELVDGTSYTANFRFR